MSTAIFLAVALQAAAVSSFTSFTITAPDQWGNPWLKIEVARNGVGIVSIFDCAGRERKIGSGRPSFKTHSNFSAFRPYQTTSIEDWTVVYNESQWEMRCWKENNECFRPPKRLDCAVVEQPIPHSTMVPFAVGQAYDKMHPRHTP